MDLVEATEIEIRDTKKEAGIAAINIMRALFSSYDKSVEGAVKGGVDIIISGAGLPNTLPSLVEKYAGIDHKINLIPIISTAQAFELICQKWEKQNYTPDAVVLEGPKAGGHLGFNYKKVKKSGDKFLENYDLFKLLTEIGIDDKKNKYGSILDVAEKYGSKEYGPIPIIVAGGIYTHDDIVYALSQPGVVAVQIGTRFAATYESGASDEFKQALVDVKQDEIVIANKNWGSPCGLPFRYIKNSPLAQQEHKNNSFCICSTLLGGAGIKKEYIVDDDVCPERYALRGGPCPGKGCASSKGLFTCGTEAYRIYKIVSVEELVNELIG